ncbi:MAG: Rne/Rng family ribonuclease [Verrucomicrobiota bacterium]
MTILKKIKSFLGIKRDGEKKEIIISEEPLETRVALLEGGVLEEFSIEREGDRSVSGNIYKGRVHNVEKGLKALFVDVGLEKNAFLHFWDAVPAALDSEIERVERQGKRAKTKRITSDDIPRLYPAGADVIVQVTKGPIGTKGARITTNISLAGRYLVLMPYSDQSGISRKIEQPSERQRLRKILYALEIPDGMGVIIRTAGEGMKARFFVRDLAVLLDRWDKVQDDLKNKPAPTILLKEPDLIERTVRDFLTEDIDSIVVDSEQEANRIRDLVGIISKRSEKKVKFFQEPVPIFEKYQINKQIESAFRRQVWLRSGAYLVIDETEAMVAIDINTGRSKGAKDQDNTILHTNLEAAEEIARQLRLRNIGGLIVIDFIDMKSRRDQQNVFDHFRNCLKRDKAKTHVLPISQLGLLEMTRQRVQESISRAIYMECPSCKGKGVVKSPETMSVEIQRELTKTFTQNLDIHELKVVVHPKVMERLRTEDEDILVELERRFEARLTFKTDHTFNIEDFKIQNVQTDQEINNNPKSNNP